MLAFAKDITQKKPQHPDEDQDSKLKQYMDYQRKLNHPQLVYHSLRYGKNNLQEAIQSSKSDPQKLEDYLQKSFPFSYRFADSKTIVMMLKKLYSGHNNSSQWYRMNPYYQAVAFDCMSLFVVFYNQLIRDSSKLLEDYTISEGVEIDFEDWTYLFFNDLDFHIGVKTDTARYPFAKRNQAIEDALEKKMQNNSSRAEALKSIRDEFEIDDVSIKVILGKKIVNEDLELFHTPMKNHIYDYLRQNQKGSWDSIDGESLMDQAYSFGSHLKVWVWKKKEKKGRW